MSNKPNVSNQNGLIAIYKNSIAGNIKKDTMQPENRFFLYDTLSEKNILLAANARLYKIVNYWEPGRSVYFGTPKNHNVNITDKILNLKTVYQEYKELCLEVEDKLDNPNIKYYYGNI